MAGERNVRIHGVGGRYMNEYPNSQGDLRERLREIDR